MHWIAPSEKNTAAATLEQRLWDAADQFRPKKSEVRRAHSPPLEIRHSTLPAPHHATGRFDFLRQPAVQRQRRGQRASEPAWFCREAQRCVEDEAERKKALKEAAKVKWFRNPETPY